MPELTVLLPAHNAADTIVRAVSSTLRALPYDSQLLVLDDGSQDDTATQAEAAGHGDSRLKVERRAAAGGIASALNWLLSQSDSRLIARMDADDVCLPWRFRVSVPAVEKTTDMVFTQVINQTGRILKPAVPYAIPPAVFPLHLLLTNPVSHPTMLAKREVIDQYRAVPAEDYDLWLRCAAQGARLRRLACWGLIYRLHPGQITASEAWRAKSWSDPRQAEAFADLAEQLTGARLERIVALKGRDHELQNFEKHLSAAIAASPQPHRWWLQHRLRQRLAWARQASPNTTTGQGEK